MMPTKEQIREMNACVQRLCVEAFTSKPGSLPHAIGAAAVALQVLKDAALEHGISPEHIAAASSGELVEKLAIHLRGKGVIRIDVVAPCCGCKAGDRDELDDGRSCGCVCHLG